MTAQIIQGYWYPAGSSKRFTATLTLQGENYLLRIEGEADKTGARSAVHASARVANITRRLTLQDMSTFETKDNDGIDLWMEGVAGQGTGRKIHRMESKWHWVSIALLAMVAITYSSVRWGLPWATELASDHMPQTVVEGVSESTMDLLDSTFFDTSDLSSAKKNELQGLFDEMLTEDQVNTYTVHFRKMGAPNAMALPNGQLVVTDSFAKIANANEFKAVMFHEIGHVEERHGIQQLVRSSIISVALALFIGDPTGLEEVLVGLPVFLMQSNYSRGHEAEADEFAFAAMMKHGIDPIHFANIMKKLDQFDFKDIEDSAQDSLEKNADDPEPSTILDYLSSHPATKSRINRAKELSAQFNKN